MVMSELETPFGNDPEEDAEGPAPASASRKGSYMCRYCPAGPWPSTSGRRRHETREHGDKKERETQTLDLNKKTGGLEFSSLSEKAKEFVEALDAAVDSSFKAASRKQLIQAYQEEADVLSKEGTELENFLDDYGLNLHQIRQIRRRIIGRAGGTRAIGGNGSSHTVAYNPVTGQSVPIIVLNQGSQQRERDQTPLIISTGNGDRPALTAPQGVTPEDVVEIIESYFDKFFKKQEEERRTAAAAEVQASAHTRRYQEPVLTADGHPVLSPNGEPIMRWVIEPIDPLSNALKFLSTNGILGGRTETAKTLTAEEVRAIIREESPKPVDPAMQELKEGFKDLKTAVETKEKIETSVKVATEHLMEGLKPQLEELRDLRSRGPLSDAQAEIAYHERLSGGMITSMDKFRDGIREDLQPIFIQTAAANLKHLGLSEQTIGDILRKPAPANSPAQATVVEKRRAAQVMEKWVKP